MSTASERRNERARAEGYSSYSQKYRAEKAGYSGKAAEYNAAVDVRRADGIVKRAAQGKLLGGGRTRTGTVISADLRDPKQAQQLSRELGRFRGDRKARVTVERSDGSVVNVGSKGGMSLDYLRDMLGPDPRDAENGEDDMDGWGDDDWDDYGWDDVADLSGDSYGSGSGSGSAAVVTVVIA